MPNLRKNTVREALPFVGVFDLFRIGIGPSSSHTVGPMRAAGFFLERCKRAGTLTKADRVNCDLYGSLALTGMGHATNTAALLGLAGEKPETIDPDKIVEIVKTVSEEKKIKVAGFSLSFDPAVDIVFHRRKFLSIHPNALMFTLWRGDNAITQQMYYSTGGGFVVTEEEFGKLPSGYVAPPFDYRSADELLECASRAKKSVAEIARANERSPARRPND